LVVTDGNQTLADSNRANNTFAVPITVRGPNLIVSAASAPATVAISNNTSVTVDYTVANDGPTTASQTFWYDGFYLSSDPVLDAGDQLLTTQVVGSGKVPLAAGASYNNSTNVSLFSPPPGNYYLLIHADEYNYQTELFENDNVRAIPLTIQG